MTASIAGRRCAPAQNSRGISMRNEMLRAAVLLASALLVSVAMGNPAPSRSGTPSEHPDHADLPSDIPGDKPQKFEQSPDNYDFVKRDVMIPMRDGVKLHTIILVPKGARHAPILMTRTPYGAGKAVSRTESTHLAAILPGGDDIVAMSGYIRVVQDVR